MHRRWREWGGAWEFRADWHEGYLTGHPLDLNLLERVALIPQEEWAKGDEHVNGIIDGYHREFLSRAPVDVEREVARLPAPAAETVPTVKEAVVRNRAALPPKFEALESLIGFEIERLQSKNYRDEEDRAECVRLIRMLSTMHQAVSGLREMVPVERAPTDAEAAKMVGLLTLYRNEFEKWPRENAGDVVDGVWRTGLVDVSVGLFIAFGLPALAGVAAGVALFGGRKIADAIGAAKNARDLGG